MQGTQGVQGRQGTQGVQGTTGSQGTIGTQGAQGLQGLQGRQGTTGSQGIQGITGSQGTTGSQGIQGVQGITGSQGIQGLIGAQGTIGTQGLQGIIGNQGTQGVQGVQGRQGLQGTIGETGLQGLQGIQGVQGIQGNSGSQGINGTQGIQGTQGTQGTQGIMGFGPVVHLTVLTANTTAAKITVEAVTFEEGTVYMVKFTLGTSVSSATLNGVPIRLGVTAVSTTTFSIGSEVIVPMTYNANTNSLHITGSYRTTDTVESYTIRWSDSGVIAGENITRYKLLMMAPDGRFHPLVTGDFTTANTKVINTQPFVADGPIIINYSTSTYEENSVVLGTNLYQAVSTSTNFSYNLNKISG